MQGAQSAFAELSGTGSVRLPGFVDVVPCYVFLSPFLIFCFQVSLFNYVFLISWAFALPYTKLRRLASSVCTVWTCVIIVCKMLYQLQTIKPENFSVNCSLVSLRHGVGGAVGPGGRVSLPGLQGREADTGGHTSPAHPVWPSSAQQVGGILAPRLF